MAREHNVAMPASRHYDVIQNIIGNIYVPSGQQAIVFVDYTSPDGTLSEFSLKPDYGMSSGGLDFYSLNSQLTLYVKPGTSVYLELDRNSTSGAAQGQFSVNRYGA